jgi:nitroimidazol reductase NimA-like FMN-containing flavoprotein (pyridoxamine 5'-phosphate oxidase superfamily)
MTRRVQRVHMSIFTRVRGFIPWNKVDIWLRGFRSIWVSTTRSDRHPHSVPVWYLWDGEHIYFTSNKNTQKARNLAQQPAIVVHAGDGDDAIILEGTAVIVNDRGEWTQVNNAYMEKYVDPHSGAKATIPESDNLYRVDVRRIMCWEYGVVATRTDWTRDAI